VRLGLLSGLNNDLEYVLRLHVGVVLRQGSDKGLVVDCILKCRDCAGESSLEERQRQRIVGEADLGYLVLSEGVFDDVDGGHTSHSTSQEGCVPDIVAGSRDPPIAAGGRDGIVAVSASMCNGRVWSVSGPSLPNLSLWDQGAASGGAGRPRRPHHPCTPPPARAGVVGPPTRPSPARRSQIPRANRYPSPSQPPATRTDEHPHRRSHTRSDGHDQRHVACRFPCWARQPE